MSTKTLTWPRTAKSSLLKQKHHAILSSDQLAALQFSRPFSSPADRRTQSVEFHTSSTSYDRLGRRAKEKLLDREFFLSLLSSASTKREAKSYLARFKTHPPKSKPATKRSEAITAQSLPSGVNLGSFYGASRSVYDSPVFLQDPTPTPYAAESPERLHLALIKITTPQLLDEPAVDGVAKTLAQLNRLGMSCCVVIDPGATEKGNNALRKTAVEQADRIAAAVDAQPDAKSVRLDSILSIPNATPGSPRVLSRRALLNPLRDAQTVIMTPLAYTEDTPKAVLLSANAAFLALTRELAGLAVFPDPDEDPLRTAKRIEKLQREVALDRVILLDPLGGIPSLSGPQTSHVFINMEQEFEDIEAQLRRAEQSTSTKDPSMLEIPKSASSGANSNTMSKFFDSEGAAASHGPTERLIPEAQEKSVLDGHLDNLRLAQKALAMLPSASSGVITSPLEVANSARPPLPSEVDVSAVATRRQRNPLIHNLLTDKPLLSSSLPLSRRGTLTHTPNPINILTSHTTFVKRGMPLTVLPDPRVQMWTPQLQPRLRLDDPSIDLGRLAHLIDDSFNRKLDVQAYLDRVNDRLAGLIIAGEYEGGAILTWELPPGVPDDGSEESLSRMVPYLDKFAVLKRSQGAGGVADIVFNAMVRTCFPSGVCWRSRKDNPVNKWYFERSHGTWKLADSNWTMFWTTPGLPEDSKKFRDYEAVCRSIQPNWADDTGVVD